jgi:hypothetical protein
MPEPGRHLAPEWRLRRASDTCPRADSVT